MRPRYAIRRTVAPTRMDPHEEAVASFMERWENLMPELLLSGEPLPEELPWVPVGKLFDAYERWMMVHQPGVMPLTSAQFGVALRRVMPDLRVTRKRQKGRFVRGYLGLKGPYSQLARTSMGRPKKNG